MRLLTAWVREFLKLLSGQRLHPLTTQCPICRQSVRLHVNKAVVALRSIMYCVPNASAQAP
jgi:hypothetical protein